MILFQLNKISVFLWLSFITWLIIIFLLSSQTGTQTSELSGGLANIISNLIYKTPTSQQVYSVNIMMRKFAHIAIFFLLSILVCLALMTTFSPSTITFVLVLAAISCLITFAFGFLDEWRKQFVNGRHFDPTEVTLNLIGGFVGVMFALLIYWIYRKYS